MKEILVYDDIAALLEALAKIYDTTITDIIETLIDNVSQEIIEDLYSR